MDQFSLREKSKSLFITPKEASDWGTKYLNQKVTRSNISYLLQYGRIKKYGEKGRPLIKIAELKSYYDASNKEAQWKKKLGKNLNWNLSFEKYKESERPSMFIGCPPTRANLFLSL